ncbi:substance-K receptor [Trichonephila clavipes]|nr:substance-K receptor [Trichonephila clavipes]
MCSLKPAKSVEAYSPQVDKECKFWRVFPAFMSFSSLDRSSKLLGSSPKIIIKLRKGKWRDFVEPVCTEMWPKITYYDEDLGQCKSIEQYRLTYYMVCSITLYFIPIVIMITAYSLILWKLWISEVPGERHAANINVQYRARKKVIKMVLVVLIAFIICWTPIQIQIFISALQGDSQVDSWTTEYQWLSNYLAFANSFINPIIYGGFNKTFREVNGDRYRARITNFFIPELSNHDVQELWFQQDGTTCPTARALIDLLKDTFGDHLISRFGPVNWPPRSC